jgi:hypothetical protein
MFALQIFFYIDIVKIFCQSLFPNKISVEKSSVKHIAIASCICFFSFDNSEYSL